VLAKRLAAVAIAVALVAGGFAVRHRRHASTTTATTATLGVVCATELAAVCDAVAAEPTTRGRITTTVESAGATYDRLTKPDAVAPAAWIVTAPWPAMVDDTRQRAGAPALFTASAPVASSKLGLVAAGARLAVAQKSCGTDPAWKCLGQANGGAWTAIGGETLWRDVTLRHRPVDAASGLSAFASAVAGWLGRTDFTQNDLDDPALRAWATRLETFVGSDPAASPIEQLRLIPVDLVATVVAEVRSDDATSRGLAVAYPSPMTRVDVVLARSTSDGRLDRVASAAAADLRATGWTAPAPDPSGLPGTATMVALLLFGRSVHS
jgi:hypothetical protein